MPSRVLTDGTLRYHDTEPRNLGLIDKLNILPSTRSLPPGNLEFFKELIKNLPTSAVMFDRQMNYVAISREFCLTYGLSGTDDIGRNHYERFPDISERWKEAHHKGLKGEAVYCLQDSFPLKDGSTCWQGWEILPWYSNHEEISGIFIFVTDRTEIVQSKEQLNFALEAAQIGLWERDLITMVDDRSDITKRLLGDSKDMPNSWAAFEKRVYAEDLPLVKEAELLAAQTNEPFSIKFRVYAHDNSLRWLCSRGETVFSEEGTAIKLRGAVFDITELKETKRELQEQRDRLEATVAIVREAERVAQIGSWEHDFVSGESFWSDGVYRIFDLDASRPPPRFENETQNLIHPGDRQRLNTQFNDTLNGIRPFDIEHRIVRPDGSIRWIRSLAEVRYDATGRPCRLIGATQDVTERHQAEDELKKLHETLEQRIEERTEELRKTTVAKSNFLANMSHEIRNPLNTVTILSELMRNKDAPDEARNRYATRIARATETVTSILDDILDFSKIEAGQIFIMNEDVDIDEILDHIKGMFIERAETKGIHFSVEKTGCFRCDRRCNIISDSKRLKQILMNLVGNAIKFTEKGNVQVQCTTKNLNKTQCEIVFDVTDTGIGIPESSFEHLFAPFTQADGGITRKYGGTGLGLSISQSLVDLMGGKIEVQSTVGLGSNFRVTIPAPISRTSLMARETTNQPNKDQLSGMHFLLVDDDAEIIESTTVLLEGFGAEVLTATNGSQAIKILRNSQNNFDAVLMDIQMPVMDGITATEVIREELFLEIPIIVVTAGVLPEQQKKALSAGITRLIRKPINPAELISVLLEYKDEDKFQT